MLHFHIVENYHVKSAIARCTYIALALKSNEPWGLIRYIICTCIQGPCFFALFFGLVAGKYS